MSFGLIQIEQERSDLWKAEVEAGYPICRRKMVYGAVFEEVIKAIYETYREMIPLPPGEPGNPRWEIRFEYCAPYSPEYGLGPAKGARPDQLTELMGGIGDMQELAAEAAGINPWQTKDAPIDWPTLAPPVSAEPADAPHAPEAPEAGETQTSDQATRRGGRPRLPRDEHGNIIRE